MIRTCHAITKTVCLFGLAAAFASTGCQKTGNPMKVGNPFGNILGHQVRSAPPVSSSSAVSGLSIAQGKPKKITEKQKTAIQASVARSLEQRGKTEQAIKAYRDLVGRDDQCALAYHRLAVLHDKKGDCKASEGFYRKALEIDPDNAEVHCDLGYSYYLQQRWEEAEKSLKRAIEIDPDHSRTHNNLGLLLARTNRKRDSLYAFFKAGCSDTEAYANIDFIKKQEQQLASVREPLGDAMTERSAPAQAGIPSRRPLPVNGFDSVQRVANRSTQFEYGSNPPPAKRFAPLPNSTFVSPDSRPKVVHARHEPTYQMKPGAKSIARREVSQITLVIPEPKTESEVSAIR